MRSILEVGSEQLPIINKKGGHTMKRTNNYLIMRDQAKSYFLKFDQQMLAERWNLPMDGQTLYVSFLNSLTASTAKAAAFSGWKQERRPALRRYSPSLICFAIQKAGRRSGRNLPRSTASTENRPVQVSPLPVRSTATPQRLERIRTRSAAPAKRCTEYAYQSVISVMNLPFLRI